MRAVADRLTRLLVPSTMAGQVVAVKAFAQVGRPALVMVYMPLASTGVTAMGVGVVITVLTAGAAPPRPM